MTLKIEAVPSKDLLLDPRNARKHSAENLAAISESLKAFGQRKPIVVTSENVVVAGNGTLEAARSLGIEKVDVVRVPNDWSDDQVKAFALADNRSAELAEWDVVVLDEQLQALTFAGVDVEAFGFAAQQIPDAAEWADVGDSIKERDGLQQMTFVLSDAQVETIKEAMRVAKSLGVFDETENVNGNGNLLARACEFFLGSHGG